MKGWTNLAQSKKLAEFLPVESADMYYAYDIAYAIPYKNGIGTEEPCWSLTSLLNYLREIDFFPEIDADESTVTMSINYYIEENGSLLTPVHNIKVQAGSFIDACVEMITKLYEQKLL